MIGDHRLEIEILRLFLRDSFVSLSINQIAGKLQKTYPSINKKVNAMIEEGMFHKVVVGRSHLCRLNLKCEKTIALLSLLEIKNKKQAKITKDKEIFYFIENLRKNCTPLFILHAKQKFIVCTNSKQKIKQYLKNTPRSIILRVVEPTELQSILLNENILDEHVLWYGYERYYEFLADNESEFRIHMDPLVKQSE